MLTLRSAGALQFGKGLQPCGCGGGADGRATIRKYEQNKEQNMETHFANFETEQSQSGIARERVMNDLRSLARDSEALLKVTAGDVSEKVIVARSRLLDALERAKSTCEDVTVQAVAGAREAANKADTVIRKHPYESLGVAFGVGLLIGVLVTRK
jgi:ElaB/YqjD/DUF883 family membrane-anchored ribosome-binding protein